MVSFQMARVLFLLVKKVIRPIDAIIQFAYRKINLKSKAFKIFVTIYLGQFVIHALWMTFLQASYININKILDSNRPGYNIEEIRPLLATLYDTLTNSTSLQPELATTAMSFYALGASFIIFLYFFRIIDGWHHKSQAYPIVRYYESRAHEKQRIAKGLDKIITDVMLSNLEYTKKLVASVPMQDMHSEALESFYSMITIEKTPQNLARLYGSLGSHSYRDVFSFDGRATRSSSPSGHWSPGPSRELNEARRTNLFEQISTLSREYSYIYRLKLDHNLVWPAHRQPLWLWWINIGRFVVFYTLYFGFWMICTGCAMFMLQTSRVWRSQHNVTAQTNILRRLTAFEIIFNMYFINEIGSPTLTEIWLGLIDESWHLYSFRKSFELYVAKLALLKERVTQNPNIYLEKSRHWKLTHECERDCIAAYIKFRYLIYEIRPMIDNSKGTSKIVTTMVFVTGLFTFGFGSKLEGLEWIEMQILMVGVFLCVNWIMFVYALFHSYCKSTINLVWTIVSTTILDPDNYMETSKNLSFMPKIDIDTPEDLTYHLTLISPHMVLLWRRVLFNQNKVLTGMTIRVYELLTLDYEGIINFNFWILSVIIILSTNL